MSFNKESLLKMKKKDLIATAQQVGADITQAKKSEDIAAKILEKLSQVPAPEKKADVKLPAKAHVIAGDGELKEFLREVEEQGAEVEVDGDVVTIKFKRRETCFNVNQPFGAIKRAVERFLVLLPGPVEAQLQR